MITILDRFFPIEISDKIYRYHFKNNIQREINEIIQHKIIFCLSRDEKADDFHLSFLVCEGHKLSSPCSNIIELLSYVP